MKSPPAGHVMSLRWRGDKATATLLKLLEGPPHLTGIVRVVALLFAATWGVSTLSWPFGPDQGFWAWFGETLAAGGAPYRDAWDTKGPVAYLLGAIPHVVFGRNEWGMRLVELGWIVLGCWAVGRTGMLRGRRIGAFAASGIFFMLYAGVGFWHTAQPDGWASVLLIIAAGLSMNAPAGGRWRLVVAGVLIGCCTLIKPTYVAFLALPALGALFIPERSFGHRLDYAAASVAGAVAVIGLVLAWLHWGGALQDFLEAQRWTATAYASVGGPSLSLIRGTTEAMLSGPLSPLLVIAALGAATSWHERRSELTIAMVWAIGAAANVAVQGKFYSYHWLPLFGAIAWLAGLGVEQTAVIVAAAARDGSQALRAARALAVGAVGLALVSLSLPVVGQVYQWGRMITGITTREHYLAAVASPPERPAAAVRDVARYLADSTHPSDYVYVWGVEPAINYLSHRPSPTRFASTRPLLEGQDSPIQRKFRAELESALRTHAPRYIVSMNREHCATVGKGAYRCGSFRTIDDLLASEYHLETEIGPYAVYRANRP